jgi:CRISPR-associated protein Csh1
MFQKATFYEKFSSYLSMNQQKKLDKQQKIHSASPFSFAFNFSLGNNKKEIQEQIRSRFSRGIDKAILEAEEKNYKLEKIKARTSDYFSNAKKVCGIPEIKEYQNYTFAFEKFCQNELFERLELLNFSVSKGKNMEEVNFTFLKEKNYIRVYFESIPDEVWQKAYLYYYNTEYPPDKVQSSDFLISYGGDKKPFLYHQTATFLENLSLSGTELASLKVFKEVLAAKSPKVVPNPLPIFVFKEELQNAVIELFNKDESSIGYKEIIEKLWEKHSTDFGNYYLLTYIGISTKVIVHDFDFVPKFEYELKDENGNHWQIINLFGLKEKGGSPKYYPPLLNIFQLEKNVFISLIGDIYKKIDFFGELKIESYKNRKTEPNRNYDNTFSSFTKYRKATFDYIYKSKRNAINSISFTEMIFNGIRDNLKHNDGYSIKEKLNIWFSLYEKFNSSKPQTSKPMASKLADYQQFVADIASGKEIPESVSLEEYAFAAGQVISFILSLSESADRSYQRMEPFVQKVKVEQLNTAIAHEIARYKHKILNYKESPFKRVSTFVLSFEEESNIKKFLPQLLAGLFADSPFYKNKNKEVEIIER